MTYLVQGVQVGKLGSHGWIYEGTPAKPLPCCLIVILINPAKAELLLSTRAIAKAASQ